MVVSTLATGSCAHLVVQLADHARVARGDLHRSLVALDLAERRKLSHHVALLAGA